MTPNEQKVEIPEDAQRICSGSSAYWCRHVADAILQNRLKEIK